MKPTPDHFTRKLMSEHQQRGVTGGLLDKAHELLIDIFCVEEIGKACMQKAKKGERREPKDYTVPRLLLKVANHYARNPETWDCCRLLINVVDVQLNGTRAERRERSANLKIEWKLHQTVELKL